MVDHDPEETHVQALADSIRKALDGPGKADDVDALVSAAMGDEAANDADDEPREQEPGQRPT